MWASAAERLSSAPRIIPRSGPTPAAGAKVAQTNEAPSPSLGDCWIIKPMIPQAPHFSVSSNPDCHPEVISFSVRWACLLSAAAAAGRSHCELSGRIPNGCDQD